MNTSPLALITPTLTGQLVQLQPLQAEHQSALIAAASDGELWNSTVTNIPSATTCADYIAAALAGEQAGNMLPFAILNQRTGQIVGSTRLWKIDLVNRKLEIGHTWLAKSAQRTGINTEAKYLLLAHAFEVLRCVRVQLSTDELNEQSRAAILRIGAKFEGILRKERIMPNGRVRNSVRFSIIDSEWEEVKSRLLEKMARQ